MSTAAARRNYQLATEGELLTWARERDERAFAALVESHRRVVSAVCSRIVHDEHLTQDAVQATLLSAWRHLDRFEGRARFSTWLCQIAHNAALAMIRRNVAEPVENVPERTGGTTHEDTIAAVHSVRWALARLPPDFRAALVLREYGNLSYQEIADAQQVSIDTVKSRISRARQGVATLLADTPRPGFA